MAIFTILYRNYYPPHGEFKLICIGKFARRTWVNFTQQYGKNRQRCQQNTYYYAVWQLLLYFYREFPSKILSVLTDFLVDFSWPCRWTCLWLTCKPCRCVCLLVFLVVSLNFALSFSWSVLKIFYFTAFFCCWVCDQGLANIQWTLELESIFIR